MTERTDAEIAAEFARIERERGGYFATDAREVLRATAESLGVTYERARAVLLNEWTGGYSG